MKIDRVHVSAARRHESFSARAPMSCQAQPPPSLPSLEKENPFDEGGQLANWRASINKRGQLRRV